jgi:serine/threonine protein kinase
MGTVYSARDQDLDRTVALKFLSSTVIASGSAERLIREAKALSSLNHPNIVTVYEVIRFGSSVAIAMELIEGQALRELCGSPLAPRRVIHVGLQIAQALAAAHGRGIVHRDIKPENIFLRPDGYIKVLDFGLARTLATEDSTYTGLFAGTLRYVSPEQVSRGSASAASDIFSLGLVLYELATGKHPFPAASPFATAHAIASSEPPAPSTIHPNVPAALEKLILDMLSKRQSDRPSAEEVVSRLETLALASHTEGLAGRTRERWTSRLSSHWLSAVLGCLVVLGVVAWLSLRRNDSNELTDFRIRPLTSQNGWEEYPAISPDGQAVAFTWSKEFAGPRQIYVKSLQDNRLLQLSRSDFDPNKGNMGALVWSPEQDRIAFKRADAQYGEPGAIYLVTVKDGVETKLLDLANANLSAGIDWSPDGTRIAFSDTVPSLHELAVYVFDLKTGEKRKLTSPPANVWGDWDPKFSPDGSILAFKRVSDFWADDIYVMPVAGGSLARITSETHGIWGQAWTRDSRSLIVSCQRNGTVFSLWRFGVGSKAHPVRFVEGGVNSITPVTSRRTDRTAWVNMLDDSNIYRVPISGGGLPEKLIASNLSDQAATYSHDGRIAYLSERSGNREIWLANADGSGQTQVTNFNGPLIDHVQWSPDNRQLAFDSRTPGPSTVFALDCKTGMDCGAPKAMTPGMSATYPAWSADGRLLYFASHQSGEWEIWKRSVSGGPAAQVTRHGGYTSQESPDGQWLFISKVSATSLWRIPGSKFNGERPSDEELVIGPPFEVKPEA